MTSVLPPNAIPYEPGMTLQLPMVEGKLRAGFPSPAADFAVKRCDLNELVITHPLATFFWWVAGVSMQPAIDNGDLLVVNRALTSSVRDGDIVVAEVDGEFTVKYFRRRRSDGRVSLVAANPTFPPIVFREGQTMTICGKVTAVVTLFR